jgi:thioesterase domain-containing protein
MTGLPEQLAPPPALPDLDAASALTHVWRTSIDQLVAADIMISTRGVAAGWAGPASGAALRAGQQGLHDLAEAVLSGMRAVGILDDWARHLKQLRVERQHLLGRIDAASADLARLALLPDNTLATPALRSRAWQQHRELCAAIASWQAQLSAADRAAIDALTAPDPVDALAADRDPRHREAAESTRRSLAEAASAGIAAYLLEFEPDAFSGDGQVVIAFGDPVAATHTAVVVPGITNDASTIDLQSLGALSLQAAATSRKARTCTIAWMGYDAPSHPALHGGRLDPRELTDLVRAVGEDAAEDGGRELAEFVDEVREVNPHTDVTVIGHSYGSTTAAHAAVDGLATDRLVFLGSPGVGDEVDRASDLGLPSGTVFVGAADRDPVTWLGGPHRIARHDIETHGVGLGDDPSQAEFGATRIKGADGRRFHLDSLDQVVLNHNVYLAPGSQFTDNVAAVVVNEQPTTTRGRTTSGEELLARWGVHEAGRLLTLRWP